MRRRGALEEIVGDLGRLSAVELGGPGVRLRPRHTAEETDIGCVRAQDITVVVCNVGC